MSVGPTPDNLPPPPADDGASRRIMVNAGWLGVQPLVLNVFGILSTAFIARRLGPAAYGRFNYGVAIVMTLGPITDLGLRALAVRRLARDPEHAAANVGILLTLRTILAVIAGIAMVSLAAVLTDNSGTAWVIRIAGASLIPAAIMTTLIDGLVAAERAKAVSVANMIGGLTLTIASVIAVALGGKEVALAASYALGPVVTASVLAREAVRTYGRIVLRWTPTEWRALTAEAFPFFRVGVLGSALNRIDIVIVGRLFGDSQAGIYSAAVSLVDRILIIPDSVSTAMLPALAKMRRAGQSLGRQFGDLVLGLQLIAWPLTLATIAAAPAILTLVFSAPYASAWPVLVMAILAFPLTAAGSLASEALLAADRERVITRGAFRSQLGALIVIYPLTLVAGPIGTRTAKILGGVGVLAYYYKAVREEFPEVFHDPRWRGMWRTLLAASVAYALTPLLWHSVVLTLTWSTLVTLTTGYAIWQRNLVPTVMAEMIRYLGRRWIPGTRAAS